MILIIGGTGQGKLSYVLNKMSLHSSDAALDFDAAESAPVFYGMHNAVRNALQDGVDPFHAVDKLLAVNPGIVIICDEVGGGLVPIDPEERLWRETVGRICCRIAENASNVVRVFCGIPMNLKGDGLWK